MEDFIDFLGFVNQSLHSKGLPRLETFMMAANFSSIVGEFLNMTIPNYCPTIVKNKFHNGHPDLVPRGLFPDDSVLHATEGVEVKSSRYSRGWQGHNPEEVWLLVFVFGAGSSSDAINNVPPQPFRFTEVLGAQLTKNDWNYSGRSGTSRRTITASVNRNGHAKMKTNWIYRNP